MHWVNHSVSHIYYPPVSLYPMSVGDCDYPILDTHPVLLHSRTSRASLLDAQQVDGLREGLGPTVIGKRGDPRGPHLLLPLSTSPALRPGKR